MLLPTEYDALCDKMKIFADLSQPAASPYMRDAACVRCGLSSLCLDAQVKIHLGGICHAGKQ